LHGTEIPSTNSTALDAITHLRPEFVAVRTSSAGTSNPTVPVVYLDGHRLAQITLLRTVPASWIKEVRYVRGALAAGRYGGDHSAGAILVTTLPASR
jgi:hypothetical protein